MTKKEIVEKCVWDDYGFANLKIHAEVLESVIDICLLPEFDKQINKSMVTALNLFLSLKKLELENIKQLLWNDCKATF